MVISTALVSVLVIVLSKLVSKRSEFFSKNSPFLVFSIFFFLVFLDSESYAFILFALLFIFLFMITEHRKGRWLVYVFLAFAAVFILFQRYVSQISILSPITSFILPAYSSNIESTSFLSRFSWLFERNYNLDLILVVLLISGIAFSLISKKKEVLFVLSLFFLGLFLYFFPEAFAYRFYREVTIFMAFIITMGLWAIFKHIVDLKKKHATMIFSVLIVVILLPSLVTPVYQRYYQSSLGQPIVTDYEYAASDWLKANTTENSLIISDFTTMQLVGSLSDRMLPINRNLNVETLRDSDVQKLWGIKNLWEYSSYNYSIINASATEPFWKTYGFGSGLNAIYVSDASTQSNSSLQISTGVGNQSTVGIIHKFDTPMNWSNVTNIYLNWDGKNTGAIWQICIAAPDDSNWFAFSFTDNFLGWQLIEVPLAFFSKVGVPNWSTVFYIAARTTSNIDSSWTLGDVGLNYSTLSFSLNSADVSSFEANVSSTDVRYMERTGMSMKDMPIYFVLTPQTIEWFKQSTLSGVVDVKTISIDPNDLALFLANPNLELVYSYRTAFYIFRVNHVII